MRKLTFKKPFLPVFGEKFTPVFPANYSPIQLFLGGRTGAWINPADVSTVFETDSGFVQSALGAPVGRAYDKSQNVLVGPQLVQNGTFDTDISGWDIYNGAEASQSGGRGIVTADTTANQGITQQIPIDAGNFYDISADAERLTTNASSMRVGLATGFGLSGIFSYLTVSTTTPASNRRLVYIPSTLYVTAVLLSPQVGAQGAVDNVSVKKVAGNHAVQADTNSRPVLAEQSGVPCLSGGAINWIASAGLYTIAYVGASGLVYLENQSLSGATNVMQSENIFEYVAVQGALGSFERQRLKSYLAQKAELI